MLLTKTDLASAEEIAALRARLQALSEADLTPDERIKFDASTAAVRELVDKLKAENDAAIAAGVFGAPFFIIDGEAFWGNDRRAQIERWLEKGPF